MNIRSLINKFRESQYGRNEELRIQVGALHAAMNRCIDKRVKNLWDVEVKVFSQWGEDGILDYLFYSLGLIKPRILELGAGNFSECNSRFAAHILNASVYAVDSREDLPVGLSRSGLMWRNSIFSEVIEIEDNNVVAITKRASKALGGIDVISVDIDGNDYWVMKNIPLNGVLVVVVEYNPIFGKDFRVSVPYEKKSRFERHRSGLLFGGSLPAFIDLLKEKNFTFVGTNRVGNNAFFVDAEKVDNINVEIPNLRFLDKFVDWRCREARDDHGELTYETIESNQGLIDKFVVVEVATGTKTTLGELRHC